MTLTVAICTYNPRFDLLRRVVAAIENQLDDVPDTQLLVIDNNSSPPLRGDDFALEHGELLFEPTPGLTAARERAIKHAAGDITVFVDDDNILAPGYLARVVEILGDWPDVGVVGGSTEPEYADSPVSWMLSHEGLLAIRPYAPTSWHITREPWDQSHFPFGAGMGVRTELARAWVASLAGGERLDGRRGDELSSCEDTDLCIFALTSGSWLAVDGHLRLTHVIAPSRLTTDHLRRLVRGNVASNDVLDRKWLPQLGAPVVGLNEGSVPMLHCKITAAWLAGLVRPKYRVTIEYFRALLDLKRANSHTAKQRTE